MGEVCEAELVSRLGVLAAAREWPNGLVSQLERHLRNAEEHELFRVNPYALAEAWAVDGNACVTLLLHATRARLFRTDWGLLCRGCGEIVQGVAGLEDVPEHFFCRACSKSRPSTLDEHVEVGFTVDREVREIAFHSPDALPIDDYVFAYRFSRNVLLRDTGEPFVDLLRRRTRVLTDLAPGACWASELDLGPGWLVGSPRVMITTEGEAATETREVTLTLDEEGFLPRPVLAPGPVALTLKNASGKTCRVFQYHCAEVPYFSMRPFLSGQRVLHDPAFRECLGTSVVRPGSGIPVEDNTLLFTDLRGSTDLYDVEGDKRAFELVSQHFECLARVVTRHSGVIVKTMGDAVMASFTRPEDGVRAALEMGPSLKLLGEDAGALQPKIGLHRGECIAVNLDGGVDYFGQTVNVAARLQGQAGANEICVSEAIYEDEDVRGLFDRLEGVKQDTVELRGVRDPCPVYRVRRP